MSLKDAYYDLLDQEDKQHSQYQFLKEMGVIYPNLNEQNADYYYRTTLPVRTDKNETVFSDAACLLRDNIWKKTKKRFSEKDCYSDISRYYEGSQYDNKVAGDSVTVGINDAIGQIRWPDGTIHIYNAGLAETCRIPLKQISIFDSGHKKLISRMKKDCLKRTESLLEMRTGSDEYVRLRFYDGEQNIEIVLFRDGTAYGKVRKIDTYFIDQLARAIKQMNDAG